MVNITEVMKKHDEIVQKKTISVKEWAQIEGISYDKALKFSHAKGFPIIKIGRDRRIVLKKLDDWLINSIGLEI